MPCKNLNGGHSLKLTDILFQTALRAAGTTSGTSVNARVTRNVFATICYIVGYVDLS